jgi:hypothetical protein
MISASSIISFVVMFHLYFKMDSDWGQVKAPSVVSQRKIYNDLATIDCKEIIEL